MQMTKFRDLLTNKAFNSQIEFPSVSVALKNHTLEISFDSKDVVKNAGYTGDVNPWLSSICYLIKDKPLSSISQLSWKVWDNVFKDEQLYWDLKQDEEVLFFNESLELLKASLDVFRGREYLYQETSPLVCRCFGIRESDILEHLQSEKMPTLDTLAGVSKAGMGCRSCVPQLKRWLVLHETKKHTHHYKDRAVSEWLLEIDYMISCFPKAQEYKMEVQSFKNQQVMISFEKEVTQLEEEKTAKELQDFLRAALDDGLTFFLRRARHFSKAKG
jgi:bacterioferritin-associated ferredoxin